MLSCPNPRAEEWQKLLEKHNGNVMAAHIEWQDPAYQADAINEELDENDFIEILTPEEEEAKKDKFTKLTEHIHLYLEDQLDTLSKKKVTNQEIKEARLQSLIENVKALEGVESIYAFIQDSHKKSKLVEQKLKDLLKNKSNLTSKEYLKQLTAINEFVSEYSILDELMKKDVTAYFSKPTNKNKKTDELTPQEMLTESISIRDNIKSRFLSEGTPLMADFLLEYQPENLKENILIEIESIQNRIKVIEDTTNVTQEYKDKRIEELNKRIEQYQNFSFDKASMVKFLNSASKDESMMNFLFDPLISSADGGLALFAAAVKAEMEKARLLDIDIREQLSEVFEKYAQTTGSTFNVAKFNEGLYEFIDVPVFDKGVATGEYDKQVAFIQKYDTNAYKNSMSKLFASLSPEIENPVTPAERAANYKRNKIIGKWFNDNTQAKSKKERELIINEKDTYLKKGILTQEQYDKWKKANIYINPETNEITYKKDLAEPANKYLSKKWQAIYDVNDNPINAKGEFHQYLWKLYSDAQAKLPKRKLEATYIIPSIEKTSLERAQDNGIKNSLNNAVTDTFKIKSYDIQYGSDKKLIPVYYVQPMDAKDVSLDLTRSVLMFSAMANRYDALNKIHGETALFKEIIKQKDFTEVNAKGESIKSKFAEKFGYEGYLLKGDTSNSQKHLDGFISMIINGEMQKKEEIFSLSADKITNSLLNYSALTSIAADLLKGVANNLQGNIQLIIEAASGEFFSRKNYTDGKLYYNKSVVSFLSDFGKSVPTSLVGKLVERYDPLQGNFKDTYGNAISASVVRKLMRTDTLFFNQHFGEHEIQVSSMFALMRATKVIDNKTKKEIDLLTAHELYGAKGVEEDTDFTDKKRQEFQNRLHALSKRMHGVYNDFDKGTAQRYSLGRLAIMYRKHLIPAYKRRYKKLSMDMELGAVTEGFYKTFWDTFAKDLVTFKWKTMQSWSTYSPFQKSQTRKVIMESCIIVSITAMIAMLVALAEDDDELKEDYAYNFMMYELIRMKSETSSYWSLPDAYRTVKSPTAMVTTTERLQKFISQFIFTWDPKKLTYKRKEGVWDKGDNKSWAYFLKLMGYSGNNITPEAAVKSFQSSFVK
jgi:hypothetical protein